jgi:hypothetical protein
VDVLNAPSRIQQMAKPKRLMMITKVPSVRVCVSISLTAPYLFQHVQKHSKTNERREGEDEGDGQSQSSALFPACFAFLLWFLLSLLSSGPLFLSFFLQGEAFSIITRQDTHKTNHNRARLGRARLVAIPPSPCPQQAIP